MSNVMRRVLQQKAESIYVSYNNNQIDECFAKIHTYYSGPITFSQIMNPLQEIFDKNKNDFSQFKINLGLYISNKLNDIKNGNICDDFNLIYKFFTELLESMTQVEQEKLSSLLSVVDTSSETERPSEKDEIPINIDEINLDDEQQHEEVQEEDIRKKKFDEDSRAFLEQLDKQEKQNPKKFSNFDLNSFENRLNQTYVSSNARQEFAEHKLHKLKTFRENLDDFVYNHKMVNLSRPRELFNCESNAKSVFPTDLQDLDPWISQSEINDVIKKNDSKRYQQLSQNIERLQNNEVKQKLTTLLNERKGGKSKHNKKKNKQKKRTYRKNKKVVR